MCARDRWGNWHWGSWRAGKGAEAGSVYLRSHGDYEVQLNHVRNVEELFAIVLHVEEKDWITDDDLNLLLAAIADLVGVELKLSGDELHPEVAVARMRSKAKWTVVHARLVASQASRNPG